MKKIVLSLIAVNLFASSVLVAAEPSATKAPVTVTAVAKPIALQCTTPGDAISGVKLSSKIDKNGNHAGSIKLTMLNDTSKFFTFSMSKGEYADFAKTGKFGVIGRTQASIEFGGGISGANYFTYNKSDNSAIFAQSGFVYILKCN
jgi:hypothetical protein